MADKKISALTGATTPLAGTEVLPIVQGAATVKVSVDNLTAGKSVSGTSFVPTGSAVPANGLYLPAANSVGFATNSTEAVRIDSGQNLLINTTAAFNSGKTNISFDSGANVGIALRQTNANNSGTFVNFAQSGTTIGTITGDATNTAYNTSSDYRLKEAIAPMTGAMAKVAALKPCTYKWKVNGSDGQGFIAHELAEVEPGCVTGEKDAVDADGNPQYQGIDTSFLVATLTAAIQEQQVLIESLTTRLTTLENK